MRIANGSVSSLDLPCEECSGRVSSKAANCPHCGAPIGETAFISGEKPRLFTIQETGKKFKIHSLLSSSLVFLGLGGGIYYYLTRDLNDPRLWGFGFILGIAVLWMIFTDIRIWWHHR